jgi:hypothetical protein
MFTQERRSVFYHHTLLLTAAESLVIQFVISSRLLRAQYRTEFWNISAFLSSNGQRMAYHTGNITGPDRQTRHKPITANAEVGSGMYSCDRQSACGWDGTTQEKCYLPGRDAPLDRYKFNDVSQERNASTFMEQAPCFLLINPLSSRLLCKNINITYLWSSALPENLPIVQPLRNLPTF